MSITKRNPSLRIDHSLHALHRTPAACPTNVRAAGPLVCDPAARSAPKSLCVVALVFVFAFLLVFDVVAVLLALLIVAVQIVVFPFVVVRFIGWSGRQARDGGARIFVLVLLVYFAVFVFILAFIVLVGFAVLIVIDLVRQRRGRARRSFGRAAACRSKREECSDA